MALIKVSFIKKVFFKEENSISINVGFFNLKLMRYKYFPSQIKSNQYTLQLNYVDIKWLYILLIITRLKKAQSSLKSLTKNWIILAIRFSVKHFLAHNCQSDNRRLVALEWRISPIVAGMEPRPRRVCHQPRVLTVGVMTRSGLVALLQSFYGLEGFVCIRSEITAEHGFCLNVWVFWAFECLSVWVFECLAGLAVFECPSGWIMVCAVPPGD